MSGAASGAAAGGKQSSHSETSSSVSNTDRRIAAQDALVLQDIGDNFDGTINYNSTDAAVAVAGMTERSVGSVVDLTGYAIDRNLTAMERLGSQSIELVDRLTDRTYGYSREAQEQATAAITNANQRAAEQVRAANDMAAQQVRTANDAARSVSNNALDRAAALIGDQSVMLDRTLRTTADLGASLSSAAMAAYQPADSKTMDVLKWGVIALAAAVIVGPMIAKGVRS